MAGLAADIGRAVSGGRLEAVPVDLRLAGIHLAGGWTRSIRRAWSATARPP